MISNASDDHAKAPLRNSVEEELPERVAAHAEIQLRDRYLRFGEREGGITVSDNASQKNGLRRRSGGEAHSECDWDEVSKCASHVSPSLPGGVSDAISLLSYPWLRWWCW